MADNKRIVLAYSGGLDTSVAISYLKERTGKDVVAVSLDVGQGGESLETIKQRALACGAVESYVVDARDEFANEYCMKALKANAMYEGVYPLVSAISRPLISKHLVRAAHQFGADTISHGCTGKGNDQVRFEGAVAALAPQLKVIAPWRLWDMRSREDLLAYLEARDIPCKATLKKIYSRDANAWHISTEGGELESTWNEPSEAVWQWTVSAEQAPNEPEYVKLTVAQGEVVAVDDQPLTPHQILMTLNERAGKHGVGRIDITENRMVGMKSRGCYETPGGTVMVAALRAVEELVLDRPTRAWREKLGAEFSHLVYDGRWFTPLCKAIVASANAIAEDLDGEVVLKMYKGQVTAVQKKSPNSLYSEDFATFGADEVYDQSHAEGFIRLYTLASRIRAMKEQHQAIGGDHTHG